MSKSLPQEPLPKPSHHILERILIEARDFGLSKRPFLACFDIDSTLLDLHLRVSAIVDNFALNPGMQEKYPSECDMLKNIQILRTDWGLKDPLARIGIDEARNPEFFREIHEHWVKGFFSNDYLFHDEPLPGAVAFVETMRSLGADIMYLTGRDVPRMLDGTRESLLQFGFPVNETDAKLVLKPDAKMYDAEFKRDILKSAEERYERIWLFENEPVNLNLIARECPEIGLVFIDSVHSGREQVSETLDRIQHFEVDLSEFRNLR